LPDMLGKKKKPNKIVRPSFSGRKGKAGFYILFQGKGRSPGAVHRVLGDGGGTTERSIKSEKKRRGAPRFRRKKQCCDTSLESKNEGGDRLTFNQEGMGKKRKSERRNQPRKKEEKRGGEGSRPRDGGKGGKALYFFNNGEEGGPDIAVMLAQKFEVDFGRGKRKKNAAWSSAKKRTSFA